MIPIKSQMLTFVQKSDVNCGNRNVSIGINSKSGPLLIHAQMMNLIKINRIQLAITVIGLLSFLCFLPSISNEFVFDDIPTIINNKDVCPEKTYFTKIFFNDFWGTPIFKEESHKSYRPLTILTFRWNFMLHGLQVTGYHLVNNILHSIVSILFFRLCLCLTHNFWESLIASIYFAIHPIHVDALKKLHNQLHLMNRGIKLRVSSHFKINEIIARLQGPTNGIKIGDLATMTERFAVIFMVEFATSLMLQVCNFRPYTRRICQEGFIPKHHQNITT